MRTKKSRSKINSYDNNVDKKVKKLSHPVNTPHRSSLKGEGITIDVQHNQLLLSHISSFCIVYLFFNRVNSFINNRQISHIQALYQKSREYTT